MYIVLSAELYILQFIAMVRATRPDLESKVTSICVLDNNPQKPVVRMANLCVVSSHTVSYSFIKQTPKMLLNTATLNVITMFSKLFIWEIYTLLSRGEDVG